MKSNYMYTAIFTCLLLLVSCSEDKKKKTPDTTVIETQSESKDSIVNPTTLEEIENAKSTIAHHYICYTNDDKPSMQLSIAFNDEGNALFVKYKGQKETIPLENVKEDFQDDGAYPTITQFYNEIYEGKKNGTYALTHSGNWDYVVYRNLTAEKIFKFTIDHDATVVGGKYRKTPCF